MTFNPLEHTIQIKTQNGPQDYLPVQFRLVWFREQCPEGTIETEVLHLDFDTGDERLADAAINRNQAQQPAQAHQEERKSIDKNAPALPDQVKAVKKLQLMLGMPHSDLDGLSAGDVAKLISELNKRLQE